MPAADPALVLYDGLCPLCQRSVRILRSLDWLNRIEYRDARDRRNLPANHADIESKQLLAEMHLFTPDRQKAFAGFHAFQWIAWRLPLLIPFAPLMSLPGIPELGQRIYLWVAKNRFRLVPCHDGACQVPLPPR